MSKLGKLWTGGVAYVSLLVGAGLSVAGNLADTHRTRGGQVDTLDNVMAAGWPILVLLAIEMFVSPRWSPRPLFQIWRWVGCLAVGGMAMVVSWTHLHDLMASRGQLAIVAILGPLAIDGMAIMATGLILSTRVAILATLATLATGSDGPGHLATVANGQGPICGQGGQDGHGPICFPLANGQDGQADMATGGASVSWPDPVATQPMATDIYPDAVGHVPGIDWDEELANFDRGVEMAIGQLGREVASEAEAFLANAGRPLPRRSVPVATGVPQEAR